MRIIHTVLLSYLLLNTCTFPVSLLNKSHGSCFVSAYASTSLTSTLVPISVQQQLHPRHGASKRHHRRWRLWSESSDRLKSEEEQRRKGILVLLTVPLAWGSFEPAVRFVYAIDPSVPPLLFSLTYYLVAASSLGFLSLLQKKSAKDQDPEADKFAENLSVRGGLELGTYLFLGNGLQVLGLKTVNSDRAAFLLQLTTIFVPLIQGFLNGDLKSIPQRTWTACFVALLGVAVISLDGKEGETLDNVSSILANFSEGDLLVMAAAFSYSFHCIRLERFARQGSAVRLAACKAFTETSWNISLLAVVLFLAYNVEGNFLSSQAVGNEIVSFVQTPNLLLNPNLPSAVIATLWTGLVTVAYTIYAQSFGQARISPTDANLIYTIQPVCTAIFAWILLGETVGPLGFVGGLLIGSAVYMVAAEGVNNQFQSK